jgi:hypothetical protein
MPSAKDRIEGWRREHNMVAIGNLGEQVALRVLHRRGYPILATQEDLRGGVENILEISTRMNPEDFVCVTPDGRLVTVNSKATVSARASGFSREGDLRRPRVAKGQNAVDYTTVRGGLPSPIEGDVDGQVIKVDLVVMLAQLFEFDDRGRTHARGAVEDIADDVIAVLRQFPDGPPPGPSAFDVEAL